MGAGNRTLLRAAHRPWSEGSPRSRSFKHRRGARFKHSPSGSDGIGDGRMEGFRKVLVDGAR